VGKKARIATLPFRAFLIRSLKRNLVTIVGLGLIVLVLAVVTR
jgi:hypothetical protein